MMQRRRFLGLTGAGLLGVAAFGALPGLVFGRPRGRAGKGKAAGAAPGTAAPAKPTVAVLYFDYAGKDAELAVLRKGLAQMLISDLAGNDDVRLVERERLEAVLAELKLAGSKKIDPKTAARVGKLLGAQYLVLGSYFSLMGSLRIDARLVHVETGRVVHSAGANGKNDEFLAIQGKVATALSGALAKGLPKRAAKPSPRKPKRRRPRRPRRLRTRTAVRYAKALDAKDRGDKAAATAHLKAVMKAQPDFEMARQDLAMLVQ